MSIKSKPIFLLIFSFLLLSSLAFGAAIFFFKGNAPPAASPSTPSSAILLTEDSAAFSIEGKEKTTRLSWDDGKIDVFSVLLADLELLTANPPKAIVWRISSFQRPPDRAEDLKREGIAGFIPSGYILGDSIPGFYQFSGKPDKIHLTVGRKYILQVDAFTPEEKLVLVEKIFTFTSSCLPPDCLPAGDVPEGHK